MKVTYKYGVEVIGYRNSRTYDPYNGKVGTMTVDCGGYTRVTYPQGAAYYLYHELIYPKHKIVLEIIKDL